MNSFCVCFDNGYIFLISSYHIREINPKLILSNSLRVGFWSVLKSLTEKFSKKNVEDLLINCGFSRIEVITAAPGHYAYGEK